MARILKFVWNCVRPLLFIHCIASLLLLLNKSILLSVMEGYFTRLLEIAVWPVVDFVTESFFCGSDTQDDDRIWDPGWERPRALVWHMVNLIRFLGCFIFLPLHYSPISGVFKELITIVLDSVYEFLTLENLIYVYLVGFFANRILPGPLRRLKKSLGLSVGIQCRHRTTHQQQQHNRNDGRCINVTDDDDESEDDDGDDDDSAADQLMVNNLGFLPLRRRRSCDVERMCCMCSHYGDHSVLLPCGHTDLCFNCSWSYHVMNLACPFCATRIQSFHRILL